MLTGHCAVRGRGVRFICKTQADSFLNSIPGQMDIRTLTPMVVSPSSSTTPGEWNHCSAAETLLSTTDFNSSAASASKFGAGVARGLPGGIASARPGGRSSSSSAPSGGGGRCCVKLGGADACGNGGCSGGVAGACAVALCAVGGSCGGGIVLAGDCAVAADSGASRLSATRRRAAADQAEVRERHFHWPRAVRLDRLHSGLGVPGRARKRCLPSRLLLPLLWLWGSCWMPATCSWMV